MHSIDGSTRNATISVDNTSAIQGVNNRSIKASQASLLFFRQQLEKMIKRTTKKISITIAWVPGHEDIEGNEVADKLAKQAAEGFSSNREDIPPLLRKPLPANVAALKQAHVKKLKERQAKLWRASKRWRMQDRLKLKLPSTSFAKITKEMKRREAALLIQFRLGHVPLNQIANGKDYTTALIGLVALFERSEKDVVSGLGSSGPGEEQALSAGLGLWIEDNTDLSLADALVGPWLFRSQNVLKHYRGFEFPSGERFAGYLERLFKHPAFEKTCSTEQLYLDSYER